MTRWPTTEARKPKSTNQTLAGALGVDRVTVYRAVKTLKQSGAISVVNHGQWSSYGLLNPPRTATTASENPPRTATTASENPPRTATTASENPPRTATTDALATFARAPGPGPGSIQGTSEESEKGVNDPGPGPGELDCPSHGGHQFFLHKDDRIGLCRKSSCSWVASVDLGVIMPVGQKPIRLQDLPTAYPDKQYRPPKWARRYYGIQQQAA